MKADGLHSDACGVTSNLGFKLAHPPPGEEIVVSGLAGKFPSSNDAYQFRENLFNKVDLVMEDARRLTTFHDDVPQRSGIVNEIEKFDAGCFGLAGKFPNSNDALQFRDNLFDKVDLLSEDERRQTVSHQDMSRRLGIVNDVEKFDAGYFGVRSSEAHRLDPACRLILEKAVEAITDAGINPSALRGTNTGVHIGISWSDAAMDFFSENKFSKRGETLLGCVRSLTAQRISYHLKLNGPSFVCDTACSSSGYALEFAYRNIRMGKYDQAIVGGVNLCLAESLTLQFTKLGVLSRDGVPRVFDEDANGYVRADAACAVLLQKAKDAKRIYCQIIHAKVSSDGYKSEGITFPSKISQLQCLEELYKECEVNPETISFVEAHATGTKVGDPEEAFAIASMYCKNRPEPLPIGSVKSNMGHSEAVSGLCSLAKIIFAMETGYLPPNINLKTPKRDITVLHDGRVKVVTEKTFWNNSQRLAALNNFGFGGANCHILLASNHKAKVNDGQPGDDLPRLICIAGRTIESINAIFDFIKNEKLDVEYIRLLQDIFCNDLTNEIYRGFLIVNKNGELERSIKIRSKVERMCLVFDGLEDEKWSKIRKDFLNIPIFARIIERMQNVFHKLEKQKILETQLEKNNVYRQDNLLLAVSTQIGLVEIIRAIGIQPDYFMGIGLGELICAYCDGLLSLKQVLTATYHIGTSKLNLAEYSNGESDVTSLVKISEAIGFQPSKASKWIRNYKSSKLTMLDVLLNPFDRQDAASSILSNSNSLIIHFDSNISASGNSLGLVDFSADDPVLSLLTNLGRLYENGVNLNPAKLYPEVKWPVSKGTPMISPHIKWKHDRDWYVISDEQKRFTADKSVYVVSTNYKEWAYLKGHVIDGSVLFPAAGYLYLVWDYISEKLYLPKESCNVAFENVKFLRASNLSRQNVVTYKVSVKADGEFQITEEDVLLVTGNVQLLEKIQEDFTDIEDLCIQDDSNRLPMLQRDVYKELKLRGYGYIDAFRGIISCNNLATKGTLKWDGNWVTLIDSMLQMNILQTDTRNLYVPTGIGKVFINSSKHDTYVTSEGTVNVYCRKEANITTCGAVEITGLFVSQIPRRKTPAEVVLESYEFVPNEGSLDLERCMRVNTQIILENALQETFKLVEVFRGETKNTEPLYKIIQKVLSDQPLVQPDIILLSNESAEPPGVDIQNKPLSSISNCLLVVAMDLLINPEMLTQAMGAIDDNGYIITRQQKTFRFTETPESLELITCYETEYEIIIMLKKYAYREPKTLEITDSVQDLSWVTKLQQLREANDDEIVIVSQNIECNGILGFFNCLRREPGGTKIRCVLLKDRDTTFNLDAEFYKKQMKKVMAVNVCKDGKWGTYRHLLLEPSEDTEAECTFVSAGNLGDFSTLKWIEGPLTTKSVIDTDDVLIQIYYSALNFRDILFASGRLPGGCGTQTRLNREGALGFDFAGRNLSGKRVFGLSLKGGLSTLCPVDSLLTWDIPEQWTMTEAVTVPIVYSTVLYAFVLTAHIRKGQTVLIHAGSGGVGQAAINVALHYGCTVFVSVGSEEKKAFVLKHFPQIKDEHIGNSRDTTFEQMILHCTNGRGVDIVLNSLTQEKLHATVRCIAKGGYYIEIGKADLLTNNELSIQLFERGVKVAGVMLDFLLNFAREKRIVSELMARHIESGAVKPLHKVVYSSEDIEAAFRFMGAGKHMGKVVIEVRPEESSKGTCVQTKKLFKCKSVFYCNPERSYVIIGGLGGFGLELADWLIVKGCKKLILVSRYGLKTGYQDLRLRFWKKYASVIHISTEDVTTRDGCIKLLKKANGFAPVDGIFNLAVDLKDALFENQSVESFMASLKPKAIATCYLDEISRKLCPDLRYFVVFSSVSAGRGNQGQTNYGLSNSIMENICEKRRVDGFPALAIQWGAVGDVGIVADMNEFNRDVVIGGTLPQRISSCFQVLETVLCQNKVVVSSMVVADKTIGGNAEEIICNILGIKHVENVNPNSTFPELGMDSITALEIKRVIEEQLDVLLSPNDLKSMTFLRLHELSENKNTENGSATKSDLLNVLLRYMNQADLSDAPSLEFNICDDGNLKLPEVSFLPGVDGMGAAFESLIPKLRCRANVCQFLFTYPNDNIQSMAKEVIKHVKRNESTFTIVAYSFGCLVALEVIALLEAEGCVGKAVFIDGSVQQIKTLAEKSLPKVDEEDTKIHLLLRILWITGFIITKEFKAELVLRKTIDEKINYAIENSSEKILSPDYFRRVFHATLGRIRAVHDYECSFKKLKSRVKLFKPLIALCPADDTAFSDLFEDPVEMKMFDGDHESILKNEVMVKEINDFISI